MGGCFLAPERRDMRDRTKLHPVLQAKINSLFRECEKKGLKIQITECLRTAAEQDALYEQGRTKPGNKVTNARGSSYSSMHQWGVAFDFCRADGKGAFYDADGFFSKVGRIGQGIGLEWGGGWKSIKDMPHFQLPDWGSTPARLKTLYGTPEKFFKSWGLNAGGAPAPKTEGYDMKTIQKGSTGKAVKVWQVIIGEKPDGEFGAETAAATKKFQKKNGLAADGVVGRLTWNRGLATL